MFKSNRSVFLLSFQLKIRDVHYRYEDDLLNPACPFALGVVIKELSAQSTDGAWVSNKPGRRL